MLATTDLPQDPPDLPASDLHASDLTVPDVDAPGLPALELPACPAGPDLPCWTADPDLWFAESPSDVEDAKALCVPCPLREACLAGALERREPWGVWGGQLVVAGVVVARKRPRGRPRKSEIAA